MKAFKKLIFISAGFLLSGLTAMGQFVPGAAAYEEMALLSSYNEIGGSARMLGIGGAQIALGGDISAALSNPAGLGFYNRSEFSFTPAFNFRNNDARFMGNPDSEFDFRLNFSNIGVVLNNTKDDIVPGSWRGGSFGISLTKVADFNGNFYYQGVNPESSLIDYFAMQANGIPVTELGENPQLYNQLFGLAYFSYLINPTSDLYVDGRDDEYEAIIFGNQAPFQQESVETSGGQYALNFSYGGNFADKLYFGLGLGLHSFNYKSNKLYTEVIEAVEGWDPIVDFTIDERNTVSGVGINGTFGLIYRPVNLVRFGVSITSPTFFNMDDERTADMYVDFDQLSGDETEVFNDYELVMTDTTILIDNIEEHNDLIVSEYRIKTPTRINGGVAFFFNKNGFISGDVEYVNYASNKVTSKDFSASTENEIIKNIYQNAFNFRLGAEYRLNIFRLRAGYSQMGDPYRDNSVDRTKRTLSAGVGVRLPSFFIDLAVQSSKFNSRYSPYAVDFDQPVVNLKNRSTSAIASIGFFF